MKKLINSLKVIILFPFINNLLNRLVNRYTASGIIIILMQLENLDILPKGVAKSVEGLPTKEIAIYTAIGVGIYLIWHIPKVRSKLDRLEYKIKLIKAEIELEKVKKELYVKKRSKL